MLNNSIARTREPGRGCRQNLLWQVLGNRWHTNQTMILSCSFMSFLVCASFSTSPTSRNATNTLQSASTNSSILLSQVSWRQSLFSQISCGCRSSCSIYRSISNQLSPSWYACERPSFYLYTPMTRALSTPHPSPMIHSSLPLSIYFHVSTTKHGNLLTVLKTTCLWIEEITPAMIPTWRPNQRSMMAMIVTVLVKVKAKFPQTDHPARANLPSMQVYQPFPHQCCLGPLLAVPLQV